jgi:mRNA-degrading endonuclease toxin of MazEF toxin-antitoxin module
LVTLPEPEPGLVIPYAYLWRHEHNRGQEEGRKTRPSVIVLSAQNNSDGTTGVTVAPVTHSPPANETQAIELPPKVKQALKLDDQRSWVVLDEVNQFTWPGFDLRPVPGSKDKFAYGFIPPKLYDIIISRILDSAAKRRLATISRD